MHVSLSSWGISWLLCICNSSCLSPACVLFFSCLCLCLCLCSLPHHIISEVGLFCFSPPFFHLLLCLFPFLRPLSKVMCTRYLFLIITWHPALQRQALKKITT